MWRLWAKALGQKEGRDEKEADKIAVIRSLIMFQLVLTNLFIISGNVLSFYKHFNEPQMGFRLDEYEFNGREVTPTNLLLLISEMEGTYQNLKYMGFKEDMDTINEMKGRYYKLYFKTKKEWQSTN